MHEFHNALRILLSIDMHELVSVGVISPDDHTAWAEFRNDPFRYFIRSGDERCRKIWLLVEQRMPGGSA
ncbi:hypothetical protein OSH11_13720 [Kaistia dalseonensis]|uniref:Uncharacterized protein n=1 Tax=Kaistia dalseonensis TaxID=410840 RepID=A0ABU0H7S7_9HYPH|nr:hypothetical protein [Kaistia dalseonensis]MCX5495767.1 hypothetical protein [Kaistia dalseonensis]MDQ0438367.1 hypothetical protein [Kaistia dalseonensis]